MRRVEAGYRASVSLLVVVAGSWLGYAAEGPASGSDDAGVRALVAGQTEFALDLYSRLAADADGSEPRNVVVSPLSLHLALAMTYGGARGETARELENVLRLQRLREKVHPTYARLVRVLQPQQGDGERKVHELAMANGLWPDGRFPLRPEFLELCRRYYDAPVMETLDYKRSPEPARRTINDWVSRKTRGKIPELIPKGLIDFTTMLVLTDALWFQAHWADEFPKDQTAEAPFLVSATRTVGVPLMHWQFDGLSYLEAPGFQAVELPYMGEETSMVILLPRDVDGLRALEKDLDRSKLEGWLDRLEPRKANLWLPRFHAAGNFKLGPVLQSMGLKTAFSSGADLSGLFRDTAAGAMAAIDEVVHGADLKLAEEGTEGAAATAVLIFFGITIDESQPVDFRADHPFLFLLRHRATGALLFLGRVVDPTVKA